MMDFALKAWSGIKGTVYKYAGSTVMEDKGNGPVASIGRYMAVGAFYYLLTECNPTTMEIIALIAMLLGYQGWSKSKWANSGTG